MANHRKTPDYRPWARDLSSGDLLTPVQAACVDKTRLADFGFEISAHSRVVERAGRE